MNFGTLIRKECVNVVPPVDSRCSDKAFALANPGLCPEGSALIIKPETALACVLGSVQFKVFQVNATGETDVTDQAAFTSSNANTAVVGATSGNATGLAAGEVTISATHDGVTATASLTVLAGTDCCENQSVATMVLVDTSRSMSQAFNGAYSTRLDYAKAAAARLISELNESKDTVGLISFNDAGNLLLSSLSADAAAVGAFVAGIAQTQQKTSFYDALSAAITELEASTADRKVIVLISDGEDTGGVYSDSNNPLSLLDNFKDQGGIVMCLGVRASVRGFPLLEAFSTGGFFVNGYDGVEDDAMDYISGLKGYLCSGNCSPEGDAYVHQGSLNYTTFINWDVVGGHVDLLGENFMDLLPGNGLYVDLAGSMADYKGVMQSKVPYTLESGHVYRFSVELAGNQRVNKTPESVRIRVFTIAGQFLLDQTILVFNYVQDFTSYPFSFTAPADMDVYLSVEQLETPADEDAIGLLLNRVKFEDTTSLTLILDDDFDDENMVYIPPNCGVGTTWVWLQDLNSYGYAEGTNCYGSGCLTEPPPAQLPDPNALADIESGWTPPRQYTSTKTQCATCPTGFINLAVTPLAAVAVTVEQCDESVVAVLDGTLWLMPSTEYQGYGIGKCSDQHSQVILTGDPSVTYNVVLRLVGLVELTRYASGNIIPATNNACLESPTNYPPSDGIDANGNRYFLTISSPYHRYALNNTVLQKVEVEPIDYEITVQMSGGCAVSMDAYAVDGMEETNPLNIVVAGVTAPPTQPFDGQFIKMEVVSVTPVP